MKNQRMNYVDISKGIGIIFVILGHNISNPEYIYSFHMPMFFILSGLTNNPNRKNFFVKKYNDLIVNYIFYSLILLLFWIFIGKKMEANFDSSTSILNGIIGFFTFNNIPGFSSMRWGAPLWFFPTLFIIQVINRKFSKYNNLLIIYLIILLVLFKFNIKFILNLKTILIGLTFYKIGEYYSQNDKFKEYCSKNLMLLIFLIISIFISQINGRVDLANEKIGNNIFLFYICSISGSFFWIEISKKIIKNKILQLIGINSIIFIVFHERAFTLIKGISVYILKIPIYNTFVAQVIYTILQIIICLILINIDRKYLSKIKNKLKLKENSNENTSGIRARIF